MFYVKALVAAVVMGALLLGYNHYNNMLADLMAVQSELSLKKVENTLLSEAKESWKLQAEVLSQAMTEMAETEAESEIEIERLTDVQRDHDIGVLAEGRPGLIERRVNRGTARIFRMFEDVTAADRRGDDRADTSGDPPGPGPNTD